MTEEATKVSEASKPTTSKKKRNKRSVPFGQMHVNATFNNTIITFTDTKGNVLSATSAGACGFRGSKKGTAYAAQVAVEKAATQVTQAHGMNKVDVYLKGIGLGRDAAVRTLTSQNINVESISDVTGVAHGGCRPRKARRV